MPTVDELPVAGTISTSDIFSLARAADGVLMRTTVGELLASVIGGGGSLGYTPINKAGDTGVGALGVSASGIALTFTGTGSVRLPQGTTAQRPDTGTAGSVRYNSTTSRYEFGHGSTWKNYVKLDGDTMTGAFVTSSTVQGQAGVTVGTGSSNVGLTMNGATATQRRIDFFTAGVQRARLGLDGSTESGSNVGSKFFLNVYSDAGGSAVTAWSVDRATSQSTFTRIFASSTITYASGAPDVNKTPLRISANYTGSTDGSGWVGLNKINISTDTLNVGSGQQAIGLYAEQSWGGTGTAGSRTGLYWILSQNAAVTGGGNFQAGLLNSRASYSAGGTDLNAGSKGALFGAGVYLNFTSGATNWRGGCALEIDYGAESGATVASLGGLQVIRWSTHDYVPPMYDWNFAIRIADQNNNETTTGAKVGLQFGGSGGGGQWGVAADGKLIAASVPGSYLTVPMDAMDGVDFGGVSFSGFAIKSKGFRVAPDGGIRVGTAKMAYAIGTAVDIDCAGSEVSAAAVTGGSSGTGIWVGAMLIDEATGTMLRVTTISGGAATGVAIYRAGLSDSPPSNPVTTFRVVLDGPTRAVATAPNINLTWATQSLLRINNSGGSVKFGTGNLGFFGVTPITKPAGVGVNVTDIHAALVNLGLISASGEGSSPDPATTFSDDFATLDVSDFGGAGVWAYASWFDPNMTDGYPINDSWAVVPTNVATPITSLYSVSAGALRLGIEETPALYAAACGDLPYVCGQIVANTFSQTYGYFEARIKAPHIIGSITAFWLMSNGPWPPEIDICEIITVAGGEQYPTATLWLSSTSIEQFNTYTGVDATQWHTYGVDWQSDFITFYIDRVQIGQYPTPSIYHDPMFPILTIENGDPDWTGPIPGGSTLSPAQFDYVKVWTEKPF